MTTVGAARIGISGIGSIGGQHARAFAALGAEVVLWDPVAGPEQVLERAGVEAEVVATLDELVERVDGVVVAAPDEHHVAQLRLARAAGRPTLVEKPLAASPEELVGLPGDDDAVLVGYVLHHHESMQRAAQLLGDGAVGTLVSFSATVGAWETIALARHRFGDGAEGRLYVDYSHEWDYVRWFAGPVAGCVAVAGRRGDRPVTPSPNVVDALLVTESGVSGSVHLDYVQDPSRREITLVGDRGTIRVTPSLGEVRLERPGRDAVEERFADPRERGLARQAAHFLHVVRGEARPAVTIADGRAAVEVAAAVRRSAESGTWAWLHPTTDQLRGAITHD